MHRTFLPLLRGAPLKYQRLLKVCTCSSDIRQVHASMIKTGLDTAPFPTSKLLASCSLIDFDHARSIFQSIRDPNLFMFNTILRGHSISDDPDIIESVSLFNSIRTRGISLDQFTFIAALKSCAKKSALGTGKQIHGLAIRSAFEFFLNVRNTLVAFYCACRVVGHAEQVFDEIPQTRDAVSWGALMNGYLQIRQTTKLMELFLVIRSCGWDMTPAVVVSALLASSDAMDWTMAESLHGYCTKIGLCLDSNIASSMITMYAKSGSMDSAWQIFDEMPQNRDIVLWNCMVDGYANNGEIQQSLALLQQMKVEGIKPNASTLVGLLSACASSGNLLLGQHIHGYAGEGMLENDEVVGTALIDMYAKCGCIDEAAEIFDRMNNKDVKSWTAMITAFGVHGRTKAALHLFLQMEEEGVRPNEVTFLAVLSACCHGGLVVAGEECFKRMVQEYHFSPTMEHYGCVVDLLGRAGLLEEAYELIKSLPIKRDPMAWRALLSACRIHGNVEIGELAKKGLIVLGDEHPTDSILLSSLYAAAGRKMDDALVRDAQGKELKREVGWSSVEICG